MFILRPQPLKRCHLAVLPGSEREREVEPQQRYGREHVRSQQGRPKSADRLTCRRNGTVVLDGPADTHRYASPVSIRKEPSVGSASRVQSVIFIDKVLLFELSRHPG